MKSECHEDLFVVYLRLQEKRKSITPPVSLEN
jgi:hypothetical protein